MKLIYPTQIFKDTPRPPIQFSRKLYALSSAVSTLVAVRRLASVALLALIVPMTFADTASAKPGPFYWIVAEHSGKVLMPENHSKEVGTRIVQMNKGNFGAQHWKIWHMGTDNNGQTVRKFENRHSHLCIWSYSTALGEVLRQHGCESGSFDSRQPEWRVSNKSDMWAGRPFTTWSEYSGQCMDVAGASQAEYTSVAQYTCHGGANQKFRLEYVPGT